MSRIAYEQELDLQRRVLDHGAQGIEVEREKSRQQIRDNLANETQKLTQAKEAAPTEIMRAEYDRKISNVTALTNDLETAMEKTAKLNLQGVQTRRDGLEDRANQDLEQRDALARQSEAQGLSLIESGRLEKELYERQLRELEERRRQRELDGR